MKIAIICDVLGKENNGTTIAAMNLIRHLRSKNYDVTVVCPDADKEGTEGYCTVKSLNFGPFNNYVRSNGVVIAKPDKQILDSVIKESDVVHLVTPFALSMAAKKIALKYGKPITASFHCQAENITSHVFLMNAHHINRWIYKFMYKHIYQYCTAVHYPTEFIRQVFEESVGHRTNAYVISNGVNSFFQKKDTPKPEEYKDKFIVLFTGRYSKEKNQPLLIKGVEKSKYKDDILIIFAGDGPKKRKIMRLAKPLKNYPVFKQFTREEMRDVLNYSDIYVHAAEIEIEAIACLEAITCGKVPLISDSPRSATRFFAIDKNNLFCHNNPADLAAKLDWWIEHPAEMQKCADMYSGYAERFNLENCMSDMEKMLNEAVKDFEV